MMACAGGLGCKRSFYRRTADRDAYCLISEKGQGPTWSLQPGFTVEPDPRSRFYDPTSNVDPALPIPAPQLYNYTLPPLSTRSPAARELSSGSELSESPGADAEGVNGAVNEAVNEELQQEVWPWTPPDGNKAELPDGMAPVISAAAWVQQSTVVAATPLQAELMEEIPPPLPELAPIGQEVFLQLPPIPTDAWASLPESCLRRMLEFEAVRDEYERTYNQAVTEDMLDPAPRVNLENILEVALINSREYQSRKETLYRVALRLSFQRFDYDLKFLSRGNGTSLAYTHDRAAGIEVNRLGIPTGLGITRSLYTGGNFVARFANDVVLTFNGPSGYSSSVGSDVFIDLFQPILQRDVQFEPLTQAERDVVYAARDFVRFRKTLFNDLAQLYYSLLLTYRGIAINTQDYFSNLREFNRASATEQAGQIPLFQVDQFEQNVLRTRGNLINSCNSLEGSLDQLKVRIGLPTEMPMNVALTELEELTLRDEASVLQEEMARKSKVFLRKQEQVGTADAISALTEVARRMLSLAEVNARLGSAEESQISELTILVALLEAEERRIEARDKNLVLMQNAQATSDEAQVLPGQLFLRNKDVIRLTLEAIRQELLLLQMAIEHSTEGDDRLTEQVDALRLQLRELAVRWQEQVDIFEELDSRLNNVPSVQQVQLLPTMIEEAQRRLSEAQQLEEEIIRVLAETGIRMANSEADLNELVESVFILRAQSPEEIGLAALDVDMDEAMLTALVQRLDLMNRRGELADSWREIKYAGDDLRSILNLRATQSIRTRSGGKNPFDFTFDDSTTRLTMDFDTPLNRRSERNIFRLTLIDYNVALRNLIEAQDSVKLAVRNDLREIELDRNQYEIAIASAALAYDRVTSTRLQVALGQGNVSARDFLEAQQDYTRSLNSVAQLHIKYIRDRIQFFLDLEQLQVDAVNYWPELRNEEYPFVANTEFSGSMPDAYGTLPPGPWYSKYIRRMERVPPGRSLNQRPPEPTP